MRAVAVPDDVWQANMSDSASDSANAESANDSVKKRELMSEHAAVMGRVAMALLGDAARVEHVLEQVAREAGSRSIPDGARPLAWLLGIVRAACATQLSKLPLRTRTGVHVSEERDSRGDTAPSTQGIGAALHAVPARIALATLKPTEREAVILALVGGLEAADVAAACNIDVGIAKTRIARGLEQLLTEKRPTGEGGEGGAS
jgi:RNA polymerase sigma-70 factor (ECF subfamily)